MLHKLKQQINRYKFTDSNRLPLRRARQFLMNRFRSVRLDMPSAPFLEHESSSYLLKADCLVYVNPVDKRLVDVSPTGKQLLAK